MAPIMLRGYLSAAEYHYQEEQADAIIRTTSYHRKDYNLAVIWFSDREHLGVRMSMSTSFQRPPCASLGTLGRLPQELLNNIFLALDIRSLPKCRQLNVRSRQAIDSLLEYQAISTHALNSLCALLRTRLAHNLSLFDFYQALCEKNCVLCGQFAGFIFLPTWRRCCFVCLQGAPELQMQTVAAVRKLLPLSAAAIRKLTSFKTLPGTYSMEESVRKARITLVPMEQAMRASKEQQQALRQAEPTRFRQNRKLNFMASCGLPHYDRQNRTTEHGISCAGCQLALEKDIIGSRGEEWAYIARDRVHGKEGFLEHFKRCEQAQLLWESSNGGSIVPPELPEGAKNGGYFKCREYGKNI